MEGKRALLTMSQLDQSKRPKHCHEAESSTATHSAYGKPRSLYLGRKVFLSHSGRDKGFARLLYRDLCSCYHDFEVAFLDEQSLPKGEPIDMEKSILEEARRSALGVLVLTDDFFMHTRNPMLELEAFKASKVDLLPIFYKMSVDEFKEEERWDRWEKKWEEWAAADDKLVIKDWRSYLKSVTVYNGLEFCKIAPDGREDLYIDEVVKEVARLIGPAVPMSRDDVYGEDRLCQRADDLYKICISKRSSSPCANLGLGKTNGLYAYNLVGIHGFSGLGKTTLCKCLCDFYFANSKGKVCYIDLGLSSEPQRLNRMQHMLSRLHRGNDKGGQNFQPDSIQVENLLKERFSNSVKDPVFLAMDNIVRESQEEALNYLTYEFPKGSKIFITSRSENILANLIDLLPESFKFSVVTEYMPALELEEARDIFQHGFPDLHKHRRSNVPAIEGNLWRDVDACVSMCTLFSKKRYHPLMLKSLAAFVRGGKWMPRPDNWKGRLAKLAAEGIVHKNDAWEQVFQVFDITYGLLAKKAKKVFLDLALCYGATISTSQNVDYYEWIKMLHSTHSNEWEWELDNSLLQLEDLCFIERQDCSSISSIWTNKYNRLKVQDLLVDYGKHKLPDKCLVLDEAQYWPDPLPSRARHVSISRCGKELRTLDLRDVKGVTVLHLLDNAGLEEVRLNRTTTAHLRSMIVSVPACTALRCIVNEKWSCQSLKWLKIEGSFNFCVRPSQRSLMLPDARSMDPGSILLSGGFQNLEQLRLDCLMPSSSSVQSIDLTPCANLKELQVSNMPGLKSIRGPESSSRLEAVSICKSPHLQELAFTVPADSKTYFWIQSCASLQRISLGCTTPSIVYGEGRAAKPKGGRRPAKSQEPSLTISNCSRLANVDGLSQYTDGFNVFSLSLKGSAQQYMFWTEIFVDLVKDAGIDSSGCKATVRDLQIYARNPVGLGGVTVLNLEDAQHIGPLISALLQAQPTHLRELIIRCQQAGDGSCGCDQNPPNFCTLPILGHDTSFWECHQEFQYCCPQVRDLSSLAQWSGLRNVTLKGCTSVEVWPDFAAMTSLRHLNLSNTSLREWPAGVHFIPHLHYLDLSGCQQLPAKELILAAITPTHPRDSETSGCCAPLLRMCPWAFASLREDLRDGTRDRHIVAVALGELSKEVADSFRRWSPPGSIGEGRIMQAFLALIYEVRFDQGRVSSADDEHITAILRGIVIRCEGLLYEGPSSPRNYHLLSRRRISSFSNRVHRRAIRWGTF